MSQSHFAEMWHDDDRTVDLVGQDESDTIGRLESILLSVTRVSKKTCARGAQN